MRRHPLTKLEGINLSGFPSGFPTDFSLFGHDEKNHKESDLLSGDFCCSSRDLGAKGISMEICEGIPEPKSLEYTSMVFGVRL